jgi:hypothetical protein
MAPEVDCSNYRRIDGQWYQKTRGGGMYPIAASKVPPECIKGGVAGRAAPQMMAPGGATKSAKLAGGAKKKVVVAARRPKKRKAATRGPKKR